MQRRCGVDFEHKAESREIKDAIFKDSYSANS